MKMPILPNGVPDWVFIRKYLLVKDKEHLKELVSQIYDWTEEKIGRVIDIGNSLPVIFLENIISLQRRAKEKPKDNLYPFVLDMLQKMMPKNRLVFITRIQDLQPGDVVIHEYEWEGKNYELGLEILEIDEKFNASLRPNPRYPSPPALHHSFNKKNFNFAIRRLPSPVLRMANPKYKYFFFK